MLTSLNIQRAHHCDAFNNARTALHAAASKNHVATCAYLLKKNGNVKARNKAGKTPVELATTDEMRQLRHTAHTAQRRQPLCVHVRVRLRL